MKAVLKHELSGYFHSLTAYVFGTFLLVFVGICAWIYQPYICRISADPDYESSGRRAKTENRPTSLFAADYNDRYYPWKISCAFSCIFNSTSNCCFLSINLCKVWRCLSFDIVWKLDRIFHYGCSTYCDRNVYFFVDRESWNGSRYLCGSCIVQLLQCQFGGLHFQQCDRFHYRTCCTDSDCRSDY